jgi:GPH family glycoside/pentoside/hexuronide:cation symporter
MKKQSSKHITDKKDKVPVFEKLMYGAGSGSFQMAIDGVNQLANPIFNITLGLAPTAVGLVGMISRITDAFTDPLMGSISDNTRSRFGRRRPYILAGALLTAFAFTLIWRVPETLGTTGIFIWYLCAMLFFYLCSTIQNVPYHTLGLELTADVHERTVVSSYKMLFGNLFTLSIPWVFRLAQADCFDGVMDGIRTISWFAGGAIVLGGILPALFVKERYARIASKAKKVRLKDGIKMTLQNKPFRLLTGIILTSYITGAMIGSLGFYIVCYHMYGGDLKAGSQMFAIAFNFYTICSMLTIPVLNMLCRRIGKLKTLQITLLIGLFGALASFFLFNKNYPHLIFISQLLSAPVITGFWTITTSMKADVCDDDELNHGARREGMFGAIGNWFMKFSGALALLIAGVILQSTGFDRDLGANQLPEAILRMRILFALVPAAASCIALYLLKIYPLDMKRMTETRVELEARRGKVTDEAERPA